MLAIFKKLRKVPNDIWLGFVTHLPGELGFFLRKRYWGTRLRHLGSNVRLETGLYFQNPEFIHINDNCWIDRNVMILAGMDYSFREKVVLKNKAFKGEPGVVYVGKNIHIGPGCIISGISSGVYLSDDCGFSAHCKIYAFSHHYRSRKSPGDTTVHFGPMAPHERQCLIVGPVQIGTNTGVALNSVILPGASIPENSFVTINSVVGPGRFAANSIISGNPAKKVDARFQTNE